MFSGLAHFWIEMIQRILRSVTLYSFTGDVYSGIKQIQLRDNLVALILITENLYCYLMSLP